MIILMPLKRRFIQDCQNEKGNALFLILIAVALLAVLSYAITQSGRGNNSANREQISIAAAQILEYTGQVQAAVTRLMTAGGCSNTQLNFASSQWSTPAAYDGIATGHAPADHSCDIFDPAGGNVPWQRPPPISQGTTASVNEYMYTAQLGIWGIGTDSYSDPAASELTLIANVTKDVCVEINSKLGIVPVTPPVPTHAYTVFGTPPFFIPGSPPSGMTFYGDYASWPSTWTIGYNVVQAPELAGKWSGCFLSTTNGGYVFYYVLVAR